MSESHPIKRGSGAPEGTAGPVPHEFAYPLLDEAAALALHTSYPALAAQAAYSPASPYEDVYGEPCAYPGAYFDLYGQESKGEQFSTNLLGRPEQDAPWGWGEPSRPLEVIHVGPCLVPGGAEQWLIDLLQFLNPRRIKVLKTIVTKPQSVDPHFVAGLRVPVEVGQAESVRRAARECDVLLCWGIELNAWLGDCRPKLCVFVAHGEGDWTRMLVQGSNRVLDHVVAVSQPVKEKCCGGVPATVIWNGVDSARLGHTRSRQAVRQALGFHPGDFVLGYVGRFSPEKRAHVVLEAAAQLPAHFKVLIVGWGRQRTELMELANALIPGRFAFVFAWDYLGDYYQAMDAVCLVSDQEGFPLVLLEAMMCQRPVIVTPVGCVPEVILDRVNGVVVSGEPHSVASAAGQLFRHPEWARGLAAEGKAFAESHGHAVRMARQYENLLHRLWLERYGPLAPAPPSAAGQSGV